MAEDINPAVIKHTQETLGKYVKKPTLTEKLLKKPPFRFLHDVFAVVIRDTGCFEGLYTADELNSEHIKDRDDKMRFLQKMIDVVRICTNVPMTVKTSKIVAGHEPEKTNELLQLMGKIIENTLNWQPAVEQVLKGKEPKTNEKPKEKEKPKDKEAVKPKESSKPTKAAGKVSKQPSVAKENKTKQRPKEKEKTAAASKDKPSSKTNKAEEKTTTTRRPKESAKPKLAKADSQGSNKSITPNKEIKSTKKVETASPVPCKHDEEPQQMETKRRSSIVKDANKDNLDFVNKDSSKSQHKEEPKVLPTTKQEERKQTPPGIVATSGKSRKPRDPGTEEQPEMSPQRQDDKSSSKSSGKSRKPQTKETPEMSPQRTDNNSRKSSAKSRKSIDLSHHDEAGEQQLPEKESLQLVQSSVSKTRQNSPEKKLEKIATPETPLKQEPQPPIPSTTGIINTEVKRESTFTREDSKDLPNKTNRPRTSLRPPSARPPSARPGAPRRRDRNIEIILQPNDQVKMSGIQVKLETFGDLDDDGENLVIIENASNVNGELPDDVGMGVAKSETGLENETAEQQGHLVQQILETQKELTQQKDFNQQIKNEKDSVNGMVMKQTSMNNLRDVIQGLTKSVNPLGKLMDFIPEDIDAMQLEFSMWRDAYTLAANQLKREKSLTESATEPMKNQLLQIESNIQEYMEMIDASRVKILQSNDKILKMLTTS